MKKLLRVIGAVLAMVVVGGCASFGGADVAAAAGNIDKVAIAKAAKAGDYATVLAEVMKAAKQKQQAIADLDEAMKAAGYEFTRTLYFDGALIEDHKRFAKEERWSRKTVGAGALPDIVVVAPVADEDWLDDMVGTLEDAGLGKVLVGD